MKNSIVKISLIGISTLFAGVCCASDVVLPPSPPPPTHAEVVARSRYQSCKGIKTLVGEEKMTLSAEGKDDYKLLCEGVASSDDPEIINAVRRVEEGLTKVGSITPDLPSSVKITNTYMAFNKLLGAVLYSQDPALDQQIFSTGALE